MELGLYEKRGDWERFKRDLEALIPEGQWETHGQGELKYTFADPVSEDLLHDLERPYWSRTADGEAAVRLMQTFLARELGSRE